MCIHIKKVPQMLCTASSILWVHLTLSISMKSSPKLAQNHLLQRTMELSNFLLLRYCLWKLIKNVFKSVSPVSFLLDKATVNKVPYTVLRIYFFYKREIHVVMNSLHVIKSNKYDGSSSAKMVYLNLIASLGLTRSEMKKIFHHAVYDGVYATPEERTC